MCAGICEVIMSEAERQRRARQRAMSVREFCRAYGIGRTLAYEQLRARRLRARKVGRRTIITEDDAEEWLGRLPAALTSETAA
jgi:excisionase family DNA binding protein